MQKKHSKYQQFAAMCGIVAPILFVGIFTFEGWIRPGYIPNEKYVSELSLGDRGLIQIINFIVFGVLFFIFARAVASEFRNKKVSQTGPTLITVFAVCLFLSGLFQMDVMTIPPSQVSLHGIIHGILGGIAFLLMPISCFVFFRRFNQDPTWSSFATWTLLMSVLLSLTLALFIVASKFTFGRNIFHNWLGLLQRMVLVPYLFWLFTFALAFYNKRYNTHNAKNE